MNELNELNGFKKLYNWLCSWRQPNGYGGYLHHAIHGTVNWEYAQLVPSYTYEPLINGFLNLYANTSNPAWLSKAEQAANDLFAILDPTYQFKFSGFEFAPKSGSIVHTINPLFAFMRIYQITKNHKYIDICRKVLESVVCTYWRGDHFSGPFNMTLTASAAMAEYGMLTGDWRLHNLYGKHTFQLVKQHKCQKGIASGLYYRNINDHSIVFPWYNSVKANAMIRYGRALEDVSWIDEGIRLLRTVHNFFLNDYSLVHSIQNEEILSCPLLIAPAAYCLSLMQQNQLLTEEEIVKAITALCSKQTDIGFFPSNSGYDWRSKVGVTAWNAFVFELLSQNYILYDDSFTAVGEYYFSEGMVSGYENDNLFELSLQNQPFCRIDKKSGQITKFPLNSWDFSIPSKYVSKAPHMVKYNMQRHSTVSYIDNNGNGVWLEKYAGNINVWSPYSIFNITDNNSLQYKGAQRYDKFSKIIYSILHPILYVPSACNIITKLLNH